MSRQLQRWNLILGAMAILLWADIAASQQQPQEQPAAQPPTAQQPGQPLGQPQGGARQRRPSGRRSQRDRMDETQVTSPSGKVSFTVLPNADRLSYTVKLDDATVIEASTMSMFVDGFDIAGSGLIQGAVERYEINETYPWHGAHSMAVNKCNGAKVSITNDLMQTAYTLEIRAV